MPYLKAIIHDCVTIDGDRIIELTGDKAKEYKSISDKLYGMTIKHYPTLIRKSGVTILEYKEE